MKEKAIVFGVDGGGSSTRLRLADADNKTMWEGRGAGINPNATNPVELSARLEALFAEAWQATGLGPTSLAAGCLGVAGADRPEEQVEFEAILRGRLGLVCPLAIVSDPDIALIGGLKRLEGYLLIAGTGSIAIARLADGTRFRAGGLGHFLGDEGSAFFIAFQAISRALRSKEGRDLPTGMLEPLMERFGLVAPAQFIALVYRRFDKALIASAADLVERHRAAGDELAVSIMGRARDELQSLVLSVCVQASSRILAPSLVLRGGLIEGNEWLRSGVKQGIAAVAPELTITEALESPTWGACLLALDLAKAQ